MVLTRSFVRAKRPGTDGFRWFLRQFGEGGNYQELLDTMVAAGRVGRSLRVGESLSAGAAIRAGSGYGVWAGLDVEVEARERCAQVSAAQRADGRMSSWWSDPAACRAGART